MAQTLRLHTLKFSRKLTAAGMDPGVGEALVEGLSEADTLDLATKADLAELRQATKADLAEHRQAGRADLAELRAEMFKQLWIMGAGIVGLTVTLVKIVP